MTSQGRAALVVIALLLHTNSIFFVWLWRRDAEVDEEEEDATAAAVKMKCFLKRMMTERHSTISK